MKKVWEILLEIAQTYSIIKFLDFVEDVVNALLVCVKFNLPWKVEKHILAFKFPQFVFQPIKIVVDIIHTIDET